MAEKKKFQELREVKKKDREEKEIEDKRKKIADSIAKSKEER